MSRVVRLLSAFPIVVNPHAVSASLVDCSDRMFVASRFLKQRPAVSIGIAHGRLSRIIAGPQRAFGAVSDFADYEYARLSGIVRQSRVERDRAARLRARMSVRTRKFELVGDLIERSDQRSDASDSQLYEKVRVGEQYLHATARISAIIAFTGWL